MGSLDRYAVIPEVRQARTTLAKQKTSMMMSMWQRKRHICENYSPYSPLSSLPPGDNQKNTECTGWQFYHWGALNGLLSVLELQNRSRSTFQDHNASLLPPN